jgi:hypothetical protein
MKLHRVLSEIDYLAKQSGKQIIWPLTKHKYESVFFYTFHKCASTLFSGYILKNVTGLWNIDYAKMIYRGKMPNRICFKRSGYVYGPIRLSVKTDTPLYEKFIKQVNTYEFVRDKLAIFLIRDPRDILVSQYYSFGFSHSLSPDTKTQNRQRSQRAKIQAMTLEEYVVNEAPSIKRYFNIAYELSKSCKRGVILKYEDMIDNYEQFSRDLSQVLKISNKVKDQIFLRTRPKAAEDISSHRRSGRPGQFRSRLNQKIIKRLNMILNPTLNLFNYYK